MSAAKIEKEKTSFSDFFSSLIPILVGAVLTITFALGKDIYDTHSSLARLDGRIDTVEQTISKDGTTFSRELDLLEKRFDSIQSDVSELKSDVKSLIRTLGEK